MAYAGGPIAPYAYGPVRSGCIELPRLTGIGATPPPPGPLLSPSEQKKLQEATRRSRMTFQGIGEDINLVTDQMKVEPAGLAKPNRVYLIGGLALVAVVLAAMFWNRKK